MKKIIAEHNLARLQVIADEYEYITRKYPDIDKEVYNEDLFQKQQVRQYEGKL